MAGKAETALDLSYLAHRLIGRGDQHGRVGSPDFLLRFVMEQRQFIRVATEDAIHPAGRHTSFSECLLHIEKYIRVHFIPAPTLGLQDTKKAGLLHFSDRLFRHITLRRALFGT